MKRILPLILLLPLVGIAATVALGANWITTCSFSHVNNDDPIVFPGQTGASHHHTFLGARTTSANSTFASLSSGATTCVMQGDRSGYWAATANYGVHPNRGLLVYYVVTSATRVFPNGLKMIVRHSSGRIRFKCGPGSGTETLAPPLSCSSGMLVAVIELPQWWDGVRLDSPDHLSHMSYSRTSAHTVQLPRQKWYLRYAVPAGQPISLQLSSGNYTTFHVDFFDGWVKSDLQRIIDQCVGRDCGTNPQ